MLSPMMHERIVEKEPAFNIGEVRFQNIENFLDVEFLTIKPQTVQMD